MQSKQALDLKVLYEHIGASEFNQVQSGTLSANGLFFVDQFYDWVPHCVEEPWKILGQLRITINLQFNL